MEIKWNGLLCKQNVGLYYRRSILTSTLLVIRDISVTGNRFCPKNCIFYSGDVQKDHSPTSVYIYFCNTYMYGIYAIHYVHISDVRKTWQGYFYQCQFRGSLEPNQTVLLHLCPLLNV